MRFLDSVRRRMTAHSCRWETLPMLSPVTDPDRASEDDHDFVRDMDYLADLECDVMRLAHSMVPRMTADEIADRLRRFDAEKRASDFLHDWAAYDTGADS
jgi:hypothetical protein